MRGRGKRWEWGNCELVKLVNLVLNGGAVEERQVGRGGG